MSQKSEKHSHALCFRPHANTHTSQKTCVHSFLQTRLHTNHFESSRASGLKLLETS